MAECETSLCPTCGMPWAEEVATYKREGTRNMEIALAEDLLESHVVRCADGHEFSVALVVDPGHRITVRVPEPPPRKVPFPEREAGGPCVGCGEPIQPGQAFVPERRGPRHLGC